MADENPEQTATLKAAIEKSGTNPLTERGLAEISALLKQADDREVKDAGKKERNDLIERAYAEEQTQLLQKMNGLQLAAHKMAERSAKLAVLAKDKAKDWGVKKLGAAVGMGKDILGWLIKGAGMAAIYALFKWLQKDGVAIFESVHGFITDVSDWFSLLFTDPMAALKILWDKMLSGAKSIGGWGWDHTFAPLWAWFEETFPGAADVLKKLWSGLTQLAGGIGTWLWDTIFSPLWEWIKLLFTDPVAAFDQLLGGLKSLGTWLWNNAILPLWDWVQLLFTDPKAAMAQFLSGYLSIGSWIYDKAILPLWNWFEETFPGAAEWVKTKWAEFMGTGIGAWLYAEIFKPFSDWLDLAFQNPVAALEAAWTFFKSFDTWIFDTVLKPFWNWFKGMFPDVAKALESFWAELTGGGDSIIGKIGTFLTGIWDWFTGLFDFSSSESTVKSLLNFVFLPHNLVVKLIDSVWEFIKGLFGFAPDEAKIPDDFSIGKMITDIAKSIWGFVKGIFGFGDDAKTPSLSATELEDEKSKFSFSKLVGGLIDNIVSFFGGMFDLDVKGIFKSIFGTLGDWGAKAWNFMFGDDEDEKLKDAATAQAKEAENAMKAMAKMAEEFKTQKLSVDSLVLGEGAASRLILESPLGIRIPAQENVEQTGGGGAVAIGGTTNVSQGSTSMIMGSSSEDKNTGKYGLNTG